MKLSVVILPLAIAVMAYLCFVYSSESLNPFTKPKIYTNRHKWRFGRRLAVSVFLASGFSSASFFSGMLTQKMAGIVGMAVWMALALALTVYHHRTKEF